MVELLFSAEAQIVIEDIQPHEKGIDIYAKRSTSEEPCPDCQRMSVKIHSYYERQPYDLPCLRTHPEISFGIAGCLQSDLSFQKREVVFRRSLKN